jgi:hypothetical protein
LCGEKTGEIIIDIKNNVHDFTSIPQAVVQIDALLTLLINIILRDRLIVDDRFTHVWDKGNESLSKLKDKHTINPFDFSRFEQIIEGPRKAIVEELCVTKSIRAIQKANEIIWETRGETFDDHMSQLVWGSAGYLARSNVFEAPYIGCPYRQALIRQTRFVARRDAVDEMDHIIRTRRANLFRSLSNDKKSTYATFNLPPLAVEVIEESNQASQLIPIAIQMRAKYKKLREWLKEYQQALDSENPKYILKHKKILESIANDIEFKSPDVIQGATKISLGTTWLNLGITVPLNKTIDRFRSSWGVRAMLNKLVFTQLGEKSLTRILAMFGEKNTQLSRITYQLLKARYSEDNSDL